MVAPNTTETANNAADAMANKTDQAIRSTQSKLNEKFDSMSGTVQNLRDQASPFVQKVTDQATQMAQRGMDAVRDGSRQVADKARYYSDGAITYVREEPVKAVLIAAAAGAGLMALLSMMSRRDRY